MRLPPHLGPIGPMSSGKELDVLGRLHLSFGDIYDMLDSMRYEMRDLEDFLMSALRTPPPETR